MSILHDKIFLDVVMNKIQIFLLVFLLISSSGCILVDPLTRAQNLVQKGKYPEAIKMLENEYKLKPSSVPIATVLARTYSDYGIILCEDQNKPPKIKYPMAKEQFAMALTLNPNLTDAKDMYEMIEKIQASYKNKTN